MNRTKLLLDELTAIKNGKHLGIAGVLKAAERTVEILTELLELEGTPQLRNALTQARMQVSLLNRYEKGDKSTN